MEVALQLIISTLMGAVVGYVTNVIAIKLLFHPERPVGFWRIKVQGLIPARREEMAVRIFDVVARYVSKEDIGEVLHEAIRGGSIRSALRRGILAEVRRLPLSHLYMNALSPIVDRLASFLESLIVGEFGAELARELADRVSVRRLVEAKVRNLTGRDVEQMFRSVAGGELKFIEYTGFILGGIIGLLHGLATALIL